jgi:hypothetical protein
MTRKKEKLYVQANVSEVRRKQVCYKVGWEHSRSGFRDRPRRTNHRAWEWKSQRGKARQGNKPKERSIPITIGRNAFKTADQCTIKWWLSERNGSEGWEKKNTEENRQDVREVRGATNCVAAWSSELHWQRHSSPARNQNVIEANQKEFNEEWVHTSWNCLYVWENPPSAKRKKRAAREEQNDKGQQKKNKPADKSVVGVTVEPKMWMGKMWIVLDDAIATQRESRLKAMF